MMQIQERQGGRVTLEVRETLERRDYERVVPQLEDTIAHRGRLPALIKLRDFRGWRPKALVDELRFDMRHRKDIARCAVVGERAAERWVTRLVSPLFEGEVRFFASGKLPEARRWLEADGEPGA